MASLIMAVTVLPWVALTVPGWAAQAMAAPVHPAVLEVAAVAQAMAVPVPTAVLAAVAQAMVVPVPTAVLAAAVQAMAAPVPMVVLVRRRSRVWWTRSLRRSRWWLSWRSGRRSRRWPGLWRLWRRGRGPLLVKPSFLPGGPLARPFCFSPFALDRAFASNVSREPKRKTRSRW